MTLDKLNDKHANDVGKKFDGGKLQWSLLPFDALIGVIERFGKGAEKYGRDNWMRVEDAKNRYFDALMRHLSAYKMGQELDDDPRFQDLKRGKYHLTAALWNLVALEYLDMREKNELTTQNVAEEKSDEVIDLKEADIIQNIAKKILRSEKMVKTLVKKRIIAPSNKE